MKTKMMGELQERAAAYHASVVAAIEAIKKEDINDKRSTFSVFRAWGQM